MLFLPGGIDAYTSMHEKELATQRLAKNERCSNTIHLNKKISISDIYPITIKDLHELI